MVEITQTVANLTESSTNLYELIKGRNLRVYPDVDLRLAVSRAMAVETSRGWRIAKAKTSNTIDIVVVLAQAALGATEQGTQVQIPVAWGQWLDQHRPFPPPPVILSGSLNKYGHSSASESEGFGTA